MLYDRGVRHEAWNLWSKFTSLCWGCLWDELEEWNRLEPIPLPSFTGWDPCKRWVSWIEIGFGTNRTSQFWEMWIESLKELISVVAHERCNPSLGIQCGILHEMSWYPVRYLDIPNWLEGSVWMSSTYNIWTYVFYWGSHTELYCSLNGQFKRPCEYAKRSKSTLKCTRNSYNYVKTIIRRWMQPWWW